MSNRADWIRLYAETRNTAAVCKRFGISPPTLRKWWRRWQEAGEGGLADRSRAPRSSPGRKVHAREAVLIRSLRDAGLGLRRIRAELAAHHGISVSEGTIRRFLRPAATPPRGILANMPAENTLAAAIAAEIVGGHLPPGAKLAEERLGERFDVGRTRIREALQTLSAAGLVVIERHRGAFVGAPSRAEIAQAYAARRLVEAELVRSLAGRLQPAQLTALRRHIAEQNDAARADNRPKLVRLLTEFHLLLAGMAENRLLAGFVETLAAKTSLASLLYDRSDTPSCAIQDHVRLVDLLEDGHGEAAAELLVMHLSANHDRQSVTYPASSDGPY